MALITIEGLEKLKRKLVELEEIEEVTLQTIAFARSLGDFSENAELDAARNELERVQGEIAKLKNDISSSTIFDQNSITADIVGFGCTVVLEDDNGDEIAYTIVHESEADISKNKLSFCSPLAQAMIGRKAGDSFSFCPPAGEKNFDILKIDYSSLVKNC